MYSLINVFCRREETFGTTEPFWQHVNFARRCPSVRSSFRPSPRAPYHHPHPIVLPGVVLVVYGVLLAKAYSSMINVLIMASVFVDQNSCVHKCHTRKVTPPGHRWPTKCQQRCNCSHTPSIDAIIKSAGAQNVVQEMLNHSPQNRSRKSHVFST